MRTSMRIRTCLVAALALAAGLTLPASLEAQLPQASARALGMGENMTASARGFAAVANNPAGLAHWESPGFSMALPSFGATGGMGPITLTDLTAWDGIIILPIQKELWLRRVNGSNSGTQDVVARAGITPIALSVGPLAFQLSGSLAGTARLNGDAMELILYGNAGRAASPSNFDLENSTVDAYALTTAALSYGIRASDRLYLGVTGKYVIGNGLVMGRDAGSTLTSDPLAVNIDFPIVSNSFDDYEFDNGSGFGFDVGAIWESPFGITFGATVQNIVSTFEWTPGTLVYRPGTAIYDLDQSTSDVDERPLEGGPQELTDMVGELTLKPVFSVGAELDLRMVRLQADIRHRVSGGMQFGPDFHAGVGAEIKALPFAPFRLNAGIITGGYTFGGGASIIVGPVNLTAGVGYEAGEIQDAVRADFALSFGWN